MFSRPLIIVVSLVLCAAGASYPGGPNCKFRSFCVISHTLTLTAATALSLTTKHLTSADGTEILAESTGDYSKPHVVFVHGLTGTGAAFDSLFKLNTLTRNLFMVRGRLYPVRESRAKLALFLSRSDTTFELTGEVESPRARKIMSLSATQRTFKRYWMGSISKGLSSLGGACHICVMQLSVLTSTLR